MMAWMKVEVAGEVRFAAYYKCKDGSIMGREILVPGGIAFKTWYRIQR